MKFYGQVKGRTFRNMQQAPMLTCKNCGRKKPEDEYKDKDGHILNLCKSCQSKRAIYEKITLEDQERKYDMTRCAKCGQYRPNSEFIGHGNTRTKCCKPCRDKQAQQTAKLKAERMLAKAERKNNDTQNLR